MNDPAHTKLINANVKVTLVSGKELIGKLWSLTSRTLWLIEEGKDVFVVFTNVLTIELLNETNIA